MKSKNLVGFIAILGVISVLYSQYDTKTEVLQFERWMKQYNVKYDSMFERAYRERIFLENLAQIEFNNKENQQYTMGVNQFTAMTQQQFVSTYLGGLLPIQTKFEIENYKNIPNYDFDWRAKGAVTPVKNQGSCGASYAFSAIGALQGLSKIKYGNLQNLSEQQIVDCSSSYGNRGCNGGLMQNSFLYAKEKGITLSTNYPYKQASGNCQIDGGNFKINGGYISIMNCNDLAFWLSSRVVSVMVDATNFRPYKSGVFNNCGNSVNHGVTLVGSKDGNWIIKNSWGTSWGQQGYMTIAGGNTCGICNIGSVPY